MERRVVEARPETLKPGRTVRARVQHPDTDLQPERDKDKRTETKNERPQALRSDSGWRVRPRRNACQSIFH